LFQGDYGVRRLRGEEPIPVPLPLFGCRLFSASLIERLGPTITALHE
jgi:hypothetical protein